MRQVRGDRAHQQKSAVALIALHEWVSISTPVINTAIFLANQGYIVDLFIVESDKFGTPSFENPNINITFVKKTIINKFFIGKLLIVLEWLKPPRRYRFIIGFDPEGLITARFMSFFWRIPYIHHSLEISNDSLPNWKESFRQSIERSCARRALLTLTQDQTRAYLLANKYEISMEKIAVSYNTSIGDIIELKCDYLRNKFGIDNNKTIVLAVGSLIVEHSIDKIVKSVNLWPPQFVLVLHGWFGNEEFKQEIVTYMNANPNRIFISTDLLPDDKKYQVFQSADIGLVFFEPINDNMRYAAGSAGKLFDFMRTGVPIIGNAIPGMKELIEGNEVGIVVNDVEELPITLTKIMKQYNHYRTSSFQRYSYYEFGKCYSEIYKQINCLIGEQR